jgi:hypothetical protein
MAFFAPVAPIHILKRLPHTSYHLLLAHDVVRQGVRGEFETFFNSSHTRRQAVVIMDNSVVELGGKPEMMDVCIEAAAIVHADVVVLPDVYIDGRATVAATFDAHDKWLAKIRSTKTSWGYFNPEFMVVPQGRDWAEWVWCAEQFAKGARSLGKVGWIGIPRNLIDSGIAPTKSRLQALRIIEMLFPTKRIHLLGFTNDMVDDLLVARQARVTGIDSAVPVRAASKGLEMSLQMPELGPRGDWWATAEYHDLMADNVNYTQQLIRR